MADTTFASRDAEYITGGAVQVPDNDKHVVVVSGPEVKAVFDESKGVTSNYFGGKDAPDGHGHGHIDVDTYGNVQFIRDADED